MKYGKLSQGIPALLAVLLLPGLLIACGGEPEITDLETQQEPEFAGLMDVSHENGWETGRSGGRLVMTATSDPKTFNHIVADETSTTDITERLLGAAVRRNQFSLEWEPWLAQSWEISENQRTITYTLRDDIFWSDGEPITADDFVRTVNEIYYDEAVTSAGSTRNSLRNAGGAWVVSSYTPAQRIVLARTRTITRSMRRGHSCRISMKLS